MIFIGHDWEKDASDAFTVSLWSPEFKYVVFKREESVFIRKILSQMIMESDRVLLLLGSPARRPQVSLPDINVTSWIGLQLHLSQVYSKPVAAVKLATFGGLPTDLLGVDIPIVESCDPVSVFAAPPHSDRYLTQG